VRHRHLEILFSKREEIINHSQDLLYQTDLECQEFFSDQTLKKEAYNTRDGVAQDIARILYSEHTASGAIYAPF